MKVLWLGGIVLPRIAEKENINSNYMNGWLIQLSEMLGKSNDIQLVYVFDANMDIKGKNEFYSYYGIKCNKASSERYGIEYITPAIEILNKEKPDIIHIWGTESSHTLAMVEACEEVGYIDRVVISIQGLVSEYAYHYYAYMPHSVCTRSTLRDLIKGNIYSGRRRFEKRGNLEKVALRKVKHVIGRTDWDKACSWDINPNLTYHYNNETLREEFYTDEWSYEKCEKYSIFCSQGHYPIKGIHLMLIALHRVLEEFPNAHLYVGGKDYLHIPKWKLGSYGLYLVQLIKKYEMEKNVTFTGFLDANQMKERYLNSNIFVSASSIENSPNSLGEAMLLGVPCISSRVGGVHNMLEHNKEGLLYPADEVYMLSYYIKILFDNPKLATEFGENARKHAVITHDPEKNKKTLIDIYNDICGEN